MQRKNIYFISFSQDPTDNVTITNNAILTLTVKDVLPGQRVTYKSEGKR